ncbi:SpvB/TcaC N-terminal domain-containing protein, partial [Kibdelosporangium lantanae]
PSGDYKATDMSPAGKWNVTAQTGDFSWTYEMRTPPVPGDLAPNLQLTYSSSSTDGKVASTNNQPGWIGEGWSLAPGYIERSYKPCADDGVVPKTGDLCWGTDNATMSLNGSVTPLVLDEKATPPLWRPKAENGAKVERLSAPGNGDNDGEYWRITMTDGTQYYFGRNRAANGSVWTVPVYGNGADEPCHDVTVCNQAWRWNLDYVVDSHGNSMSYFYAPETNSYGANVGKTTMQYTRGGTLLRAEYGTRAGHEGD